MPPIPSIKRCKPLLGTYVSVYLSAEMNTATLIDLGNLVFDEIEEIEKMMSFHNPESELYYLNREAASHPCELSDDMSVVLMTALQLSKQTNGRYDISIAPELVNQGLLPENQASVDVGERGNWQDITLIDNRLYFEKPLLLDLGGIAKGYAVDKAFLAISEQIDDVIINAGGDLRMKQWQGKDVEIKTPCFGESGSVNVTMQGPALATTASYYMGKNLSAIVDPETKQLVHDPRSISVFAPNCMVADALTKVVLLAENPADIVGSMHASALLVEPNGAIRNLSL
ncbi:MAG: FAD:protein FMN transferase [Gammaproteobacteria bacterium]|nr:FAD:protein FMN transferase [Gammaproteobacteria bacterium]